ncbi:MAG: helix-turn-helix domain-containing protein [Parcubacteria group bacterium]
MYEEIFHQLGLSDDEALVYEALLDLGSTSIKDILIRVPIKRGTLYNVLYSLCDRRLVEEKKANNKKLFQIKNPQRLHDLVDQREQEIRKNRDILAEMMPGLKSKYNLVFRKPGIKFYEGKEGVKKVMYDSLSSKTEIFTYLDVEAVQKHIPKINIAYVRKRNALGIKKRMITIDSPYVRKRAATYNPDTTQIRFLDYKQYPFATAMQIYDNKVSYMTLEKENKIGVIIEDKNISAMHRVLFEYTWITAQTLQNLIQK